MKLGSELNLDAVKDFALDVWEDLGRTRLAGVAVGLAVALLMLTARSCCARAGRRRGCCGQPDHPPTPPTEDGRLVRRPE